jgi:IS30 family transposase
MSGYCHLSLEERCAIARLHEDGQSIRQIAAALDREPSTISRELKRNKGARVGYKPAYTQAQAVARRWSGSRLARQAGQSVISHESIYRFIYAQARRTNDGSWRQYLPRAKTKRGRRPKPGGSSASFIRLRRPLAERPPDAASRHAPGHWEADYMLFARQGHNLLVTHERHSRLTLILQIPDRKARTTADALIGLLTPMPASLRQSVTFDNPVLSLSKGATSSHSTTDSIRSAATPSSAMSMPHGRRAASKMPSAACDAISREKPTSPASHPKTSPHSPEPTTIPHENASTSKPPPRQSPYRCTSNVNPHPSFRWG